MVSSLESPPLHRRRIAAGKAGCNSSAPQLASGRERAACRPGPFCGAVPPQRALQAAVRYLQVTGRAESGKPGP